RVDSPEARSIRRPARQTRPGARAHVKPPAEEARARPVDRSRAAGVAFLGSSVVSPVSAIAAGAAPSGAGWGPASSGAAVLDRGFFAIYAVASPRDHPYYPARACRRYRPRRRDHAGVRAGGSGGPRRVLGSAAARVGRCGAAAGDL